MDLTHVRFGVFQELPEFKGKLKTPEDGGVVEEVTRYGGEVV